MTNYQGTEGLKQYIKDKELANVKLHLGCGGERWRDFVNVDLYSFDENQKDSSRSGCVADVFADIRDLRLEDNSVEEIFTSHTLEHFVKWEAIEMIADWHRILRNGGRLVVEMPDFVRCVAWLFHPLSHRRQLARNQFYGNQWDRLEYETHRYVWSAREFRKALIEAGFSKVEITHQTQTHYSGRDMRAVAMK
jgi:predicted SAM-dependent methyltransferase